MRRLEPGREVYLDHAAGAPLLPEAREALLAALDALPGNPGSSHGAGRRARAILEDARERVARLAGAGPREVVFTSGTSESNTLALEGALLALGPSAPLVCSAACHPSTLTMAHAWERAGRPVRTTGIGPDMRIDHREVAEALAGHPGLVTLPLVEPVTGAIEPLAAVAGVLPAGSALHADAAQAAGRVDVAQLAARASYVSFSAHKLGGVAGVGALIVRDGAPFEAPRGGGAQERGRRPGTESVALAAAFGAAAEVALAALGTQSAHAASVLSPLADLIEVDERAELLTTPPSAPGIVALRFTGCRGDVLLAALDRFGFRISTGTACASGARVPPAVVIAAGRPPDIAAEVVRVSIGRGTTHSDVLAFTNALRAAIQRAREA